MPPWPLEASSGILTILETTGFTELLLRKTLPREEDVRYPICTGGRRACPPEDIGGIYGYYSYLEALADPNPEMHGDAVEWLGKDFDPAAFDLEVVNSSLEFMRKQMK